MHTSNIIANEIKPLDFLSRMRYYINKLYSRAQKAPCMVAMPYPVLGRSGAGNSGSLEYASTPIACAWHTYIITFFSAEVNNKVIAEQLKEGKQCLKRM